MIFTLDEAIAIQAALETYDEVPRNQLKYEVQHAVCGSALTKLESLTALTVFTKQEYTVMALAVSYIIRISPQRSVFLLCALRDKLLDLADPSGGR